MHPQTDAVITNSGILSVFLLNALKDLGRKPGSGVLLALFDEEIEFDQFIDFSYLKINQQPKRIGQLSAKLLYSLLTGNPSAEKVHCVSTSIELINGPIGSPAQ